MPANYQLKWSPGHILFILGANIFVLSLLSIIIYLYLFVLTGLPLLTSQILMIGFLALLLLAVWNTVYPVVGTKPLVLTRQGFSAYNCAEVPWDDVTHFDIVITPGKHMIYNLHFYLVDESEAATKVRFFGKTISPPRIAVNLN